MNKLQLNSEDFSVESLIEEMRKTPMMWVPKHLPINDLYLLSFKSEKERGIFETSISDTEDISLLIFNHTY